jgi:dephospho-CoA kinase
MSTVLALAGKIGSGKSTLAVRFAEIMGWSRASFGDYIRQVVRRRGIQETREILQDIGDELISEDLGGFCRAVLEQANWTSGQPLVIDGIRHAEINNRLRRLVAPQKYVLVYVSVDEQTRKERLRKRLRLEGVNEHELVERVEIHPTEEQVKNILPLIADYKLDGTEPIPVLINKLKVISSEEPLEVSVPANDANVRELIEAVRHLKPAKQRELLARIWPEQAARSGDKIWRSVRFGPAMRVMAHVPEQEQYVAELRDLLLQGALARLENENDNTYEIYGTDRTYLVTMIPAREFAAILSSWQTNSVPREVVLQDAE